MEKVNAKELDVKLHNVVVAITSYPDYEMQRQFLLCYDYENFIVLDGWHCSCYDFDDTEWEAIKYTREELNTLSNSEYNKDNLFWKQVAIALL